MRSRRHGGQDLMLMKLSALFFALGFWGAQALGDAVKPADSGTGGGMGGTGHTEDQSKNLPIVPLSNASKVKCPEGNVIGAFELRKNQTDNSSVNPVVLAHKLCAETVFLLEAGDQVRLLLPDDQLIEIKASGGASMQLQRKAHPAWEDRIEVEIFARSEKVDVKINNDRLTIDPGYVGQIWVDKAQSFWGLRKKLRP